MLLNAYFDCRAERRPVRLVVLKGRQQGCSTGVGAIGFMHVVCFAGANLLIAANEKGTSSKNIYNMYRLYKNEWPYKLPVAYENDGELIEFTRALNHGAINVTGERTVVSYTFKFIHLSEAAKFYNLDKFMDDMLETVPMHLLDATIFVESTAEGYGDQFHELWQVAQAYGKEGIGWQPLFIPWFVHEEYSYEFKNEREREKFAENLHDSEEKVFGDEVALLRLPKINIPIRPGEVREIGVTLENLRWRRDKIVMKKLALPSFYRQYPSTADEAFRASMLSPLDRKSLDWYTENRVHYPELTQKGDPHPKAGELRTPFDTGEFFEKDEVSNTFEFKEVQHPIVKRWEEVHPFRRYIIGVDMAQGMETGDFSCAVVICRLPFRVVAMLRGLDGRRLDPNEFGRQLFALGQYYNNAMICPENNADGGSLIRDLVNWNYSNLVPEKTITGNSAGNRFGWNNNGQTHRRMLAELQRVVRERTIDIKDETIIEEAKHLKYRPGRGGGVQAAKKGEKRRPGSLAAGYYDDTIFALGGALLCDASLDDAPKSEKQIENEARLERIQTRVQRKQQNVYDENVWLDDC